MRVIDRIKFVYDKTNICYTGILTVQVNSYREPCQLLLIDSQATVQVPGILMRSDSQDLFHTSSPVPWIGTLDIRILPVYLVLDLFHVGCNTILLIQFYHCEFKLFSLESCLSPM